MNDLPIEQLRGLVTLSETRSFTQAAEQLYRTQPALSLQIKRLEERLGTPLVHRNGRSISMTEAGEVLVNYARKILELNEEALAKLNLTETEGKVRIGVLEEVAIGPLVDLLTKFGRLCSKVEIELEVATSWDLSRQIARNEVCLAVANTEYASVDVESLWQEQYVWAYNPHYDVFSKDSLPIVMEPTGYPCSIRDHALAILRNLNRPWHITFSSYSLVAIRAAVQAGLGIGLIAESAMSPEMDVLNTAGAIEGIPPATIGLYRSKEAGSLAVETLFDFLVDHLQTPPFKKEIERQIRG